MYPNEEEVEEAYLESITEMDSSFIKLNVPYTHINICVAVKLKINALNIGIEMPYESAVATVAILSDEMKELILKEYYENPIPNRTDRKC